MTSPQFAVKNLVCSHDKHDGKASMEYIPGTAVPDRSLALNESTLAGHFESGHVAAAAEQSSLGSSDEYTQPTEDDESIASTLLSLNPKMRPSLETSEEPPAKRVAFSSTTSSPKPLRTPQLLSINTPTTTTTTSSSSAPLNPQSWFTTPQPTHHPMYYPNAAQAAYFQHPGGVPAFNNPAMQMMPFYMAPQQPHTSLQRLDPMHLQPSIPTYHPQQPMYWAPHAMQYPYRFPQAPVQSAPMMLVHPRGHFKRATATAIPTNIQKQQQQLQHQQRAPKSAVATHPSKTPADMPVLGLGIIRDGVSCVVRPSTSSSSGTATRPYSPSDACSSMQQTEDPEIGEEDVLGVGVLRDGASAVVRVKVGGMIGVHSRKWKSEVTDAVGETGHVANAANVGSGDTPVKRNRRPRGK
ncbi:hypothetical protein HDU81_010702 [Chytriomyces hyalinus]|nr:hypothetical protein HDU81_010702 [Chytriomyces hyalinus]